MHLPMHPRTTGCCTRERIGSVGVVEEVGRHAMEAAGKSRNEGTMSVPTTILGLPQVGGIKAVPEAGKTEPLRNAGTMTKRATWKASARESVPIRTNPDPARPVRMAGKARTTQTDQEDPKP